MMLFNVASRPHVEAHCSNANQNSCFHFANFVRSLFGKMIKKDFFFYLHQSGFEPDPPPTRVACNPSTPSMPTQLLFFFRLLTRLGSAAVCATADFFEGEHNTPPKKKH
jgi:hypothetical protein